MVERTFVELKEALRRAGRDYDHIGWNGESVNDSDGASRFEPMPDGSVRMTGSYRGKPGKVEWFESEDAAVGA